MPYRKHHWLRQKTTNKLSCASCLTIKCDPQKVCYSMEKKKKIVHKRKKNRNVKGKKAKDDWYGKQSTLQSCFETGNCAWSFRWIWPTQVIEMTAWLKTQVQVSIVCEERRSKLHVSHKISESTKIMNLSFTRRFNLIKKWGFIASLTWTYNLCTFYIPTIYLRLRQRNWNVISQITFIRQKKILPSFKLMYCLELWIL